MKMLFSEKRVQVLRNVRPKVSLDVVDGDRPTVVSRVKNDYEYNNNKTMNIKILNTLDRETKIITIMMPGGTRCYVRRDRVRTTTRQRSPSRTAKIDSAD